MHKHDIIDKFERLSNLADDKNYRSGYKRFYMINSQDGNIPVYGMYDYGTKKYILSEPYMDVGLIFTEIEQTLRRV